MRQKSWYGRLDRNFVRDNRRYAITSALIGFAVGSLATCTLCGKAGAAECPTGVSKCKVLVLTPDMENALAGPNMILDTAEWGNRSGLSGAVQFFKKAIETAPPGESKKPEEPKK